MAETVLFDRYRLLEPAGAGGSAEVWRALDLRTGEVVAVKRLHPVVFGDAAGRARLRREFEALHGIREPHVVAVRDLRIGDREAILVLDFVDGPSLAHLLAGQRPEVPAVDGERSVAIVGDVAAALAAAHAAGLVHRDVTPGNILLAPDGSAHLTDFGIAVDGDGGSTVVTAAGTLMGTLRYLAPEQLRGRSATPSSDLHALAAVAYELLAGRPAYRASTPVELVEEQQAGPPPIRNVTPDLDRAVRQGLAADPGDRPGDVTTFAQTLRASLARQTASDATIPIAVPGTAPIDVPVAAAVAGPPPVEGSATPSGSSAPRPRTRPHPRASTVAALLAAALAVALVAAANLNRPSAVGGPDAAAPSVRAVAPSAQATPKPAPQSKPPAEKPKPDKGKGHGRGNGGEGDQG